MTYLAKWRPFYSPTAFPNSYSLANDVFRDLFVSHDAERGQAAPANGQAQARRGWAPRVDVREKADGYVLQVELPGLSPEQVELTLDGETLTLKGEKQQVAKQEGETVHLGERLFGTFERTFRFGAPVDPDAVEARFEHGLLTVVVHKAKEARARTIPIKSAE